VAPVIGQQRSSSAAAMYPAAAAAAPQTTLLSLSPGLSVATNPYGATALSHGANTVFPGSQPLIAVSAVASDVPTLMSQLASLQASLMASTMYGSVPPPCLYGASSAGVPQSRDGASHAAFTSPTSGSHERPHNA